MVNCDSVQRHPTIRPPGFDLPSKQRRSLNRFSKTKDIVMIVALAVCDYKYLDYCRFRAFAYTALDNITCSFLPRFL